jgi:hypothetical protein
LEKKLYRRIPEDYVTGSSSFSIGESFHRTGLGFFGDLSSNFLSFSCISRSHHYGEACFGVLEGKTTPDVTSSWYHCNCASRQVQRCHHSSQNLFLPKPKPTRKKDPTKKKSNNDQMKEPAAAGAAAEMLDCSSLFDKM